MKLEGYQEWGKITKNKRGKWEHSVECVQCGVFFRTKFRTRKLKCLTCKEKNALAQKELLKLRNSRSHWNRKLESIGVSS